MFWGLILGIAIGVIFYPQIMVGVRKAVRFIKENTEDGENINRIDDSDS